ncbi:ribosomal protein S18 acetylase RimI-like enzyme [Maritalea mobilis]|uniref:Ribosomal protein S18 acetylase RimI-like enzyme n=1 Tax=Maritalea mobilis TaxID=483324 RepID=A0A4R6VR15_9HYPH|nr:GNAT family N-acetyltransferase [Maritalea mobilis]TDQ66463.1 ribosomal protein S18 acetylase RimI-like enzyme [Maritalea mobilis]
MGQEITIRPCRVEDSDALRVCLREVWHATYDSFVGVARVEEFVELWLTDAQLQKEAESPEIVSLLAWSGDAIVGQALLREIAPGTVRLARLYVQPAFHGIGVGKSLFGEGLEAFPNAELVHLEVYEPNRRAIGFYQSLGFVETARQQSEYAPDGVFEILMEMKL